MKQQLAGATLAASALLTAGCNPEDAPKLHTATEAPSASPENYATINPEIVENLGVLTINAAGVDTEALSTERSKDIEAAAANLSKATGNKISFHLNEYGGVEVTPTATDIKALKKVDLPAEARLEIEERIVEQGIEKARESGKVIGRDDILAISLEVPEPADKASQEAYGEANGFEQSASSAGITAVRVNDASPNVLIHELAHAINESQENKVMHSNTANCDAFLEVPGKSDKLPLTMDSKAAQTCVAIEYGDKSTVMGNAEAKKLDKDPFNAFQLLQLEALATDQLKTIEQPGNYQVILDSLTSPEKGSTKMIRISMPKGVSAPFVGADPSLNYAYCLELSSGAKNNQSIKLMVAGFSNDGKPVGATYAIPLNTVSEQDPGLPAAFMGQFFKDSRFGLSLAATQPNQSGKPAIVTITRQA